jgi:hypothetical protein
MRAAIKTQAIRRSVVDGDDTPEQLVRVYVYIESSPFIASWCVGFVVCCDAGCGPTANLPTGQQSCAWYYSIELENCVSVVLTLPHSCSDIFASKVCDV